MKMKQKHFDHIKESIDRLLTKHDKVKLITAYETGQFPRSDKVKDLNKRFRWDLFYACEFKSLSYLDNLHIDTALRKICPKIEKRY